jgi:hypothetical protein
LDTYRQFITALYDVFSRGQRGLPMPPGDVKEIINVILDQSETLPGYLRDRLDSVRQITSASMNEPGEGMNLAIFNADGITLSDHQIEVPLNSYQIQELCQFHMCYDQFLYPLISWTESGGCGILQSEKPEGAATLIREVLISLILQLCDHFIHQLATLREEFVCVVYGRLINLKAKFLAQEERRCFEREDEICAHECEDNLKEYGLRPFISHSLVDSYEYWHHVPANCFALSARLALQLSFLRLQ